MAWFKNLKKDSLVIILVLIYLLADMIFTGHEIYIFNALPVVLLLIYLTLARLDLMYFIIVFFTPLSVQLIEFMPSSSVDFAIPTEPMLFGMMIVFYYKIIYDKSFDSRIIKHPVTYALLFNIGWILITSITSSMPLVSFKFLLARIWFITIYYLLAILVFRRYKSIGVFIWCYVGSMIVVIIYTISRHLHYGLYDAKFAHIVMNPFFRDHTSYGAILAMLIFGLGGAILHRGNNLLVRLVLWGSWLLIGVALLLSYTRAAWISVIISLGVLCLTIFRIRFRYILLIGVVALIYFAGKRTEIIQKMEQNRQGSSASIAEHVKSMSNITTDESNLERLNRWNSALRMFRERSIFGWGPGTYMFRYAPYQLAREKTAISTDFGDLGNAHSEYIGPLAESGILGSLSFITIGIVSLITGFKVYRRLKDKRLKSVILGLILGLITYLVHGTLNNFLDTDKASALFWGFIAAFVSLDIYYPWDQQKTESISEELDPQHGDIVKN
jgi:putative inorganic carbon (HCO3(-)) transporter